jgi:hypothetical protein
MSNMLSMNHYSPAFRVLVLFVQNPDLKMTSAEMRRKWPDMATGTPVALRLRHYKRMGIFKCEESPERLKCGAKELTWSAGPVLLQMLD